MRRTILMTAALAATLAGSVAAQQRQGGPGMGGMPMQPATIDEMTTKLKLTPDQAKQVQVLRADYMKATAPQWKAMAEMRSARVAGVPSDSMRAMMQAMRPQMEALHTQSQAYEAGVNKVLTAEQQQAWKAWRDERREAARESMRARQGAPGR